MITVPTLWILAGWSTEDYWIDGFVTTGLVLMFVGFGTGCWWSYLHDEAKK